MPLQAFARYPGQNNGSPVLPRNVQSHGTPLSKMAVSLGQYNSRGTMLARRQQRKIY